MDPEAEEALRNGGRAGLTAFAKEKLNKWKETEVNIAVVGESGAGKSSFINTIRDINDEDDRNYAMTDVVECTSERKSYNFPDNPKIKMWDLPGAGTENFKAEEYAKKMQFEQYDGFVILSKDRFTQNDKMIVEETRKIKKPFFFARTKMDEVMRSEKRKKKAAFSDKETKTKIIEDCMKNLGRDPSQKVFLIANISDDELNKDFPDVEFDNDLLKEEIAENLPELQKTALVFSLTCNAQGLIALKKKEISERFKYLAIISAAGGAVPIPCVSMAIDIPIMVEEHHFQKKQLGIDDDSMNKKCESVGLEKIDLLNRIGEKLTMRSLMEQKIFELMFVNDALALKNAATVAYTAIISSTEVLETGSSFIPIVGPLIAGAISGGSTYALLSIMLNAHVHTANGCVAAIEDIARETMK